MSSFFFVCYGLTLGGNAMRKMFNWLAVWLESMFPEYTEDLPRVDNRHRSIVYPEVPDSALSIYRWYGLYYEGNSRRPLPNNCMFVLDSLSKQPEWKRKGRKYFTLEDWLNVLYSSEPERIFKERVCYIETNHQLP